MTRLTLVSHVLCPYVQRAAIALAEKGVAFERVVIDLDAKPDWFTALSPLGKVPLLRVEAPGRSEAVLFESSVICEWVEETQPGPRLHPDDATERARHRAWMEFGSGALADIWAIETARDADAFEAARISLSAKMRRLEEVLGDGPWFGGNRFGLVDAVFAPAFRYFDLFDTIANLGVFAATPKVTAWRGALADRPSVRAAVGEGYGDALRAFLERREAYLLTRRSAS